MSLQVCKSVGWVKNTQQYETQSPRNLLTKIYYCTTVHFETWNPHNLCIVSKYYWNFIDKLFDASFRKFNFNSTWSRWTRLLGGILQIIVIFSELLGKWILARWIWDKNLVFIPQLLEDKTLLINLSCNMLHFMTKTASRAK